MKQYRRIAQLRTIDALRDHLSSLSVDLPIDESVTSGPDAPLAQPLTWSGRTIGNRCCVLPMEGWDGTEDGQPTDLTRRRWRNFGLSGAKLIFGGEAVAVRHEGRANPRQLLMNERNLAGIAGLRDELLNAHRESFHRTDDLLIGLQLTHSGRFSSPDPDWRGQPRILYRHPYLDKKHNLPADYPVMSDEDIRLLTRDYIGAAIRAQRAGYDFVNIKHCHGYLGHEFLSAVDRPGPYGGSFENRTRFLREIAAGVRAEAPGLGLGVRLSAFDSLPFQPGPENTGEPVAQNGLPYRYAFGCAANGLDYNPEEPRAFFDLLHALDIRLVCISGGSPYYTPHLIRPALFPPSDGYVTPEDPLCGVARHIAVTAGLKRHRPELIVVGSGYSYLQEWVPNVAQAVIRQGMADSVGLGRMILSYPRMFADILSGQALERKRICRTFSDCTTAPRNHLVSGCYPLDEFYQLLPQASLLKEIKRTLS